MSNIINNHKDIYTAYLSWKNPNKLKNTLDTQKSIIFHTHTSVFFQEISPKDMELATQYPFINVASSNKNIGIANAFVNLADDAISLNKKYFMFIENDWEIHENANYILKYLTLAKNIIDEKNIDLIHLRHSKNPGEPLFCDIDRGTYDKNNRRKLESRFWQNPATIYPEFVQQEKIGLENWYFTISKHQNWTNNPFICSIDFLKKILSTIKQSSIFQEDNLSNTQKYRGLEDTISGFDNWHKHNYKIAASNRGLFTHMGDRKRKH